MKLFISLVLALFMVTPAMAGQDPYIAIVGKDCVPGTSNYFQICPDLNGADPFYFSPKHTQFMYNEAAAPFFINEVSFDRFPPVTLSTRVGRAGTEQFRSKTPAVVPEVCWVPESGLPTPSLLSAKTPAGNAGFYEYFIRLPKKPDGEINIVIQCGVLKPNGNNPSGGIELCAAETGERVGAGFCVRQEVEPGTNPVNNLALPRITAIAYPGDYNSFPPFHLTAFRNPGAYSPFDATTGLLVNGGSAQVLDGSVGTRVLLKACMDKTIVAKLPVTGERTAYAAAIEFETDLELGDWIYVRIDVPRQNSVDIYCHSQSVRIAGIGESPF